ncbi:MAG: M23 family metallopeptidase [Bacteroidia bacterium]
MGVFILLLSLSGIAGDSSKVVAARSRKLYEGLERLSEQLPKMWWDRRWLAPFRPQDITALLAPNLPITIKLQASEEALSFIVPVRGALNSGFGFRWGWQFHYGLDIDLRLGDTVVAAMDGEVRLAGYDPGGYGYYCVIAHPNGLETVYGHFSRLLVTPETQVKAGQPIGLGGSTGLSTGPHLHFEVRFLGEPIDVSALIDFPNGQLLERELHLSRETFAHLKTLRNAVYHTVRPGECLSVIARRYRVSVGYLCRLNGLSSRSVLRVGQRLRIR